MAKNCGKCSKPINGIDVVICRGYCGGFFHLNECSGLYFVSNKKNLFWLCDNCAELFENSHFRMISNQVDEKSPLTSLTTAISELRTEIKQLHAKPAASPAVTPRWSTIVQKRGTKRPRIIEPNAHAQDSCRVGCKKAQENGNVVSVPICKPEAENLFWLYLSKIRPDVTVEAVRDMTKANLGIEDDPKVIKLVPKDRDIESLSFVSFKIGLDPSLEDKALNPDNWPEGLLFREFVDYGAPKFRPPLKFNTQSPLTLHQTTISPITPVMDLS